MNTPRSLFLGHGAPTLALSSHPAAESLRQLGKTLEAPKAVIVVSPHRQAHRFDPGGAARFSAWHDFGGFAKELYTLSYDPPGNPTLAARVADLIGAAGLPSQISQDARIDHGIWVPLRLMWPRAQIPVVPVSQQMSGTATHYALGRALRPLTDEGVLVIGSGSITHNLGDVVRWDEQAPVEAWAREFDDWIAEQIASGDIDALLRYRELSPHAAHAHPTEEHLLPLFVALGAGKSGAPLHRSFSYGTVSMASYAFQ